MFLFIAAVVQWTCRIKMKTNSSKAMWTTTSEQEREREWEKNLCTPKMLKQMIIYYWSHSGHLKTRFYDLSTRFSQLLLSLSLFCSLNRIFFCRRQRRRCRYFKVRLRHEAIDRNWILSHVNRFVKASDRSVCFFPSLVAFLSLLHIYDMLSHSRCRSLASDSMLKSNERKQKQKKWQNQQMHSNCPFRRFSQCVMSLCKCTFAVHFAKIDVVSFIFALSFWSTDKNTTLSSLLLLLLVSFSLIFFLIWCTAVVICTRFQFFFLFTADLNDMQVCMKLISS